VIVEDYARLFRMLELNRIDALIFGRKPGNVFIRQMNLSQKIIDLPMTIIDAELYLSISKKSKYLDTLPKIEQQFLSADYQNWQKDLFEKYNRVIARPKHQKEQ
jgi:hypothetical protein